MRIRLELLIVIVLNIPITINSCRMLWNSWG